MSDLQAQLTDELHRLQLKTKAGFDITRVEWIPTSPNLRPNNDLVENGKARGERVHDDGNMSRWVIRIYERESAKAAFHVLHHEFYEHIMMKPSQTFVELSNVLLKLLNKLQYETQEDMVEHLAEMEDKEFEQLTKPDSKR